MIDPVARAQTHVLRAYEGAEREREMFVRPDGGAAYVFELGHGGWTGELVPLDGSVPERLPRADLGGRPVASVILDPREAARVSALPSPPHLLTRDEIRAAVPRYADVRVESESYLLTTRGKLKDVFGGHSSEDRSIPVWVVARIGEFTWQGTTGPVPRDTHPPCQVWTIDARTGSTMSYGLGGLPMCAAFASPRASP